MSGNPDIAFAIASTHALLLSARLLIGALAVFGVALFVLTVAGGCIRFFAGAAFVRFLERFSR
ncbi:MAG: hypothetical protein KDE14_01705 [Rhodobacteraceae bacterium]|nr:hypothetical protein [Paracoccaceae bacterium]